jgi:hypothetical protein
MPSWKEDNGKEITQKHIYIHINTNNQLNLWHVIPNVENIFIFVTVSPEHHTRYLF